MPIPRWAPVEIVDVGSVDPNYVGPLVLATLAYPEENNLDLRLLTAFRLSGRLFMESEVADGVWFATARGGALPADLKTLNGGIKRLDARLRKRLDAGWMALKPLLSAERGEPPLHAWGGRWNQSAEIRKACAELGIANPKHFQNRFWYPAFPVLHLAAAWAELRGAALNRGEPADDAYRMVRDPGYLLDLLLRARDMEELIDRSALSIGSEQLQRFRGKLGTVLI
jgi:hypothetical protein